MAAAEEPSSLNSTASDSPNPTQFMLLYNKDFISIGSIKIRVSGEKLKVQFFDEAGTELSDFFNPPFDFLTGWTAADIKVSVQTSGLNCYWDIFTKIEPEFRPDTMGSKLPLDISQ